jgi:hypothetical protein
LYAIYNTTRKMSSDCLVFRIIEKDNSPQREDAEIFILYDSYHSLYLLRGKRSDTRKLAMKDFSFESYSPEAVYQFLSFVIPYDSGCVFELYSYRNLPTDKDDITFDLLRTERDPTTEVVAYENNQIRKSQILKILSILSEITNDYVPDNVDDDYEETEKDRLAKWNAECDKRNEW